MSLSSSCRSHCYCDPKVNNGDERKNSCRLKIKEKVTVFLHFFKKGEPHSDVRKPNGINFHLFLFFTNGDERKNSCRLKIKEKVTVFLHFFKKGEPHSDVRKPNGINFHLFLFFTRFDYNTTAQRRADHNLQYLQKPMP